jgi:hypothetical protein
MLPGFVFLLIIPERFQELLLVMVVLPPTGNPLALAGLTRTVEGPEAALFVDGLDAEIALRHDGLLGGCCRLES